MALLGVLVHSIVFVAGSSIVPDYRGEDWRGAVSALPNSGAVVLYPGLVETRNLDWLQLPERWAYMTAPVSAYRRGLSREDTFVLPFELGLEDRAYADSLVTGHLRSARSITLIVRGRLYGPAWARWFTNRLARNACRKAREYLFQGVEVHVLSCHASP